MEEKKSLNVSVYLLTLAKHGSEVRFQTFSYVCKGSCAKKWLVGLNSASKIGINLFLKGDKKSVYLNLSSR